MIIRQEESTPIGDFYHDTGIFVIETSLANMVDEFEVDTDQLCFFCDGLIEKLKALKNHIKKIEKAWDKKQRQEDFQAGLKSSCL